MGFLVGIMKYRINTPEPTGLHMVETSPDKLRKIFSRKWRVLSDEVDGPTMLEQVWKDYLRDLGVHYIWKFSDYYSDPTDHLLEYLSSSPWDGYVIRDPSHNSQFICVPREIGDKALVLGILP
ncbi:hypothetical protein EBZ39_10255 [bacterium]|nr:hypothetical protein [bacterium]